MNARAISKNVKVSPTKLRIYANAVRGNNLEKAFNWLRSRTIKRTVPLMKTLFSAFSNARQGDTEISAMSQMRIKEIRIDQGMTFRYFKPGAQGRVSPQKRRSSHISVVLEKVQAQEIRG